MAAGAQASPGQPPLPPDIQAQANPEQAQSVFNAQGVGQPQPGMQIVQQISQHMQKLDAWVGEAKNMLQSYDPSLLPLLEQIGKPAMEIVKAVEEKAKRSGMAQGSPVVPPQGPPNPAAGPPNPNAAG
jgi:hypothetical protein